MLGGKANCNWRGKALLRKRGELLERPFAHCYETGGLRRTHLKGHARILKRLLIHVAGCNLALVMRTLFGLGTPRGLQGFAGNLFDAFVALLDNLWTNGKEISHAPSRSAAPVAVGLAA